ncbi:MAG: hypothetical protein J6L92_06800 [Clostridia bacterium]|nr:hypothetical protein [Clostridia bacterium]
MKKAEKKNVDLTTIAQNCSQYSPIAALRSDAGGSPCTCEICRKWDGKRCAIGLDNVIAKSITTFS